MGIADLSSWSSHIWEGTSSQRICSTGSITLSQEVYGILIKSGVSLSLSRHFPFSFGACCGSGATNLLPGAQCWRWRSSLRSDSVSPVTTKVITQMLFVARVSAKVKALWMPKGLKLLRLVLCVSGSLDTFVATSLLKVVSVNFQRYPHNAIRDYFSGKAQPMST